MGRETLTHIPAYLSIASLARELEISQSQVYSLVKSGVLPKPIKLSSGCVRWSWVTVQAAMASLEGGSLLEDEADPFIRGIQNVAQAKESRRATA